MINWVSVRDVDRMTFSNPELRLNLMKALFKSIPSHPVEHEDLKQVSSINYVLDLHARIAPSCA